MYPHAIITLTFIFESSKYECIRWLLELFGFLIIKRTHYIRYTDKNQYVFSSSSSWDLILSVTVLKSKTSLCCSKEFPHAVDFS